MQSVRRTAKTVIVALEDTSEITQAFEATIFADYDASKQRAKRHCELVVRHSLASYAVENHRTPVTAVTSVGDFMVRIGRPKNIFRGDPCPGCGSTPPVALLKAGIGCTSWRPAG